MTERKARRWADVKVRLEDYDRSGLLGVIRDLYDASAVNRRFLHARFAPTASVYDEYRVLVRKAVYPDPLGRRPIRLRDAIAAIAEFKRSTGDIGGTVDLMLEFVEAGTEQAVDLGFGDDAYFAALERQVGGAVRLLDALSEEDRAKAAVRLIRLGEHQASLGWGYGDFLGDVSSKVQAHQASRAGPRIATQSSSARSPTGVAKRERSRPSATRKPMRGQERSA